MDEWPSKSPTTDDPRSSINQTCNGLVHLMEKECVVLLFICATHTHTHTKCNSLHCLSFKLEIHEGSISYRQILAHSVLGNISRKGVVIKWSSSRFLFTPKYDRKRMTYSVLKQYVFWRRCCKLRFPESNANPWKITDLSILCTVHWRKGFFLGHKLTIFNFFTRQKCNGSLT